MALSPPLRRLIESAAPLFAGEAEVVRTYWDSPLRTIETDLRWLELQVFKEFKGSGVGDYDNRGVIMGPLTEVLEVLPRMDIEVPRHRIRDLLEGLYEEFTHLVAFADVYDAIRPEGTPKLDPHRCQGWEEDNVLTRLRYKTLAEHGEIGARASKFSEGGYCTLFREGMRIAGRGGNDALIADACARVYDDEFEHMLGGIVGLDAGRNDGCRMDPDGGAGRGTAQGPRRHAERPVLQPAPAGARRGNPRRRHRPHRVRLRQGRSPDGGVGPRSQSIPSITRKSRSTAPSSFTTAAW